MALTKATYSMVSGAPVNVKDFGAVGDGVIDDTAAVQAAIDSIAKGTLFFPVGDYRVTSKISINNKNQQNDGTARNLVIDGYGARLISEVTSGAAYELRANKGLNINGLSFAGDAAAYVDVEGLWYSTWQDVNFSRVVKFASLNTSTFDSHYWNDFHTCGFGGGIELHIGTEGVDRTEFNANNFYNCRINGGDYAISVYGTAYMKDNNFYGCDISYYTTAFLYVDQVIAGGEINFYGGFFDSSGGVANNNTNNLVVNFFGPAACPNMYPLANKIGYASRQTIDQVSGVRIGGRLSTSAVNYVKNGALSIWNGNTPASVTNSGATLTRHDGGPLGSYLNFSSGTTRNVTFSTVPVPFDGQYSMTVVWRYNSGGTQSATAIDGVVSIYGTIGSSGTDWCISSSNVYLTAGQYASAIFSSTSSGANFDVAYVGISYGRQSQLYAPTVPLVARATYDPPSLADGEGATTTVTCTGAVLGMFAQASFSANLQGITVTAWVSATDTVSVRFQNESGGTLDLASGTLTVQATW